MNSKKNVKAKSTIIIYYLVALFNIFLTLLAIGKIYFRT